MQRSRGRRRWYLLKLDNTCKTSVVASVVAEHNHVKEADVNVTTSPSPWDRVILKTVMFSAFSSFKTCLEQTAYVMMSSQCKLRTWTCGTVASQTATARERENSNKKWTQHELIPRGETPTIPSEHFFYHNKIDTNLLRSLIR